MQENFIPEELIRAFRESNGVIFIGAGISQSANLPGWNELIYPLAEKLSIKPDLPKGKLSDKKLMSIPQYYRTNRGHKALNDYIEERLSNPISHSKIYDLISQLPTKIFYTTNFDTLLEDKLRQRGIRFDLIKDNKSAIDHSSRKKDKRQIIKIHGSITDPHTLILTKSDYSKFFVDRPLIAETLMNDLSTKVFLFIGYSLSDPDFNAIYDQVLYRMDKKGPRHFVCLNNVDKFEKKELESIGLNILDLSERGENRTIQTESFIAELVHKTSDIVHLNKFYDRIDKGETMPIIVASVMDTNTRYLLQTYADMFTANQLATDLSKIGVKGKVISDEDALINKDELLKRNLILVGSPLGNKFSEYIFNEAESLGNTFPQSFFRDLDENILYIDHEGQEFTSNISDDADKKNDFALLARYVNPWAQDSYIYIFAGLQAIGTQAVGKYLEISKYKKFFPNTLDDKPIAIIIEISYTEQNHFNYDYDFEEEIPLNK